MMLKAFSYITLISLTMLVYNCYIDGDIGPDGSQSLEQVVVPTANIAAGNSVSFAITQCSGKSILLGWGTNENGQLGNSSLVKEVDTGNGKELRIVETSPTPVPVKLPSDVTAVSVETGRGSIAGAIADKAGKKYLYTWGYDSDLNGKLPVLSKDKIDAILNPKLVALPSSPIDLAVGIRHFIVLLDNNTVMTWGDNSQSQLGNEESAKRLVPKQVPLPQGLNVIGVEASSFGSYLIAKNGSDIEVYAWGYAPSGQMAGISKVEQSGSTILRTPTRLSIPRGLQIKKVSPSSEFVFILTTEGEQKSSLYLWGSGSWPRTIQKLSFGDLNSRAEVQADVLDIEAGGQQIPILFSINGKQILYNFVDLSLSSTGVLYLGGYYTCGPEGQKASIDSNKIQIPADAIITKISSKDSHVIAVIKQGSNNTLRSWGTNLKGELGNGTFSNAVESIPQIVQLSCQSTQNISSNLDMLRLRGPSITKIHAGAYSSFVIRDGKLYGWGENGFGQLSDGTYENRSKPILITVKTGVQVLDISSKLSVVTATVLENNKVEVYTWGHFYFNGDKPTKPPKPVKILFPSDRRENSIVKKVETGAGYHFALVENTDKTNDLYSWGFNGQCELGNECVEGKPYSDSLPYRNNVKKIRFPSSVKSVKDISAGSPNFESNNAFALVENIDGSEDLYVWGRISSFELIGKTSSDGFSQNNIVNTPTKVKMSLPPGARIVRVANGYGQFLFLSSENGQVFLYKVFNVVEKVVFGDPDPAKNLNLLVEGVSNGGYYDLLQLNINGKQSLYNYALMSLSPDNRTTYLLQSYDCGPEGIKYNTKDPEANKIKLGDVSEFLGFSSGRVHCLALVNINGKISLYAWGANLSGQLGNGQIETNINKEIDSPPILVNLPD